MVLRCRSVSPSPERRKSSGGRAGKPTRGLSRSRRIVGPVGFSVCVAQGPRRHAHRETDACCKALVKRLAPTVHLQLAQFASFTRMGHAALSLCKLLPRRSQSPCRTAH